MKDIIIATHGHLSYEFKDTIELFVGKKDNIRCFGMTKEKASTAAQKELTEMINDSDEEQLIILTDLMGGSPANICAELLMEGHRFELLSGLNLPMLLTLLTQDNNEISAKELVRNILTEGTNGIIDIGDVIRKGSTDND